MTHEATLHKVQNVKITKETEAKHGGDHRNFVFKGKDKEFKVSVFGDFEVEFIGNYKKHGIPLDYKDEDGNVDRHQLMDDLEQYVDIEDDVEMLEAMISEVKKRVKEGELQ